MGRVVGRGTRRAASAQRRLAGRGAAAAYGGTPSDDSVMRLIRHLKDRGLEVVLYPFVMMDIAADNALPDPWTGAAGQPAYPWRGRITCDPAPGRAGTADGERCGGNADRGVLRHGGGRRLRGRKRGGFVFRPRRVELPPAHPALRASRASRGGVDGFIIGSELRRTDARALGIRRLSGGHAARARSPPTCAPILGPATKIVYAADWTEYGAHVRDGGAEVRFPLDPLWSHVGDRRGRHRLSIRRSPTGAMAPTMPIWPRRAALRPRLPAPAICAAARPSTGTMRRGRSRNAQTRTPITDGAYGKPWVFRAKDLVGLVVEPACRARRRRRDSRRPRGRRSSKPIWLTEIGVPAVDKGANAPNVFPDPKSSECGYPAVLRRRPRRSRPARGLEAILSRFDPALAGHPAGDESGLASSMAGRMVDPGHVFVWAWDARPFPGLPGFRPRLGRCGELGDRPLDHRPHRGRAARSADRRHPRRFRPRDRRAGRRRFRRRLCDRPADVGARGARAAGAACGFDAVARSRARCRYGRGRRSVTTLAEDDLVLPTDREPARLVRAQETELAARGRDRVHRLRPDYRRAAVASRRLAGGAEREARPISRSSPTRRGAASRRHLAAGSLGRARERRVRAAAEPARARRRRRGRPDDRRTSARGRGPQHHRCRGARDAGAVDRSRRVRRAARRRRGAAPRPPPSLGPVQASLLDLPIVTRRRAAGPAAARGVRRSLARAGGDLALGRRIRRSSAWRSRWRRRSSARRSTICRRGRPAAGTGRAACACDCYGGALASVIRYAGAQRRQCRPQCSGPTAPGRCCNSPMPSWSAAHL